MTQCQRNEEQVWNFLYLQQAHFTAVRYILSLNGTLVALGSLLYADVLGKIIKSCSALQI